MKYRKMSLFAKWLRDVRFIRECKNILRENLDRDYDEEDSLRDLTVVAANALWWERHKPTNEMTGDIVTDPPVRHRVKSVEQMEEILGEKRGWEVVGPGMYWDKDMWATCGGYVEPHEYDVYRWRGVIAGWYYLDEWVEKIPS